MRGFVSSGMPRRGGRDESGAGKAPPRTDEHVAPPRYGSISCPHSVRARRLEGRVKNLTHLSWLLAFQDVWFKLRAPGESLARCEEVHAIACLTDQNPSTLAIRAGGIMGNHLAPTVMQEHCDGQGTDRAAQCRRTVWIAGWLFTIGLNLTFWKGVLAIIVWPSHVGVWVSTLFSSGS